MPNLQMPGSLGLKPKLTLALGKGVPLRITIGGKVYERLSAPDGSGFLFNPDTGAPRYARIS